MAIVTDEVVKRDEALSDSFRDTFRQSLNVKNIHVLPKHLQWEGYTNRPVIYTYRHDPERINRFLDNGWTIITAKANEIDDRSVATKAEKAVRDKPIECVYNSGHKAVWMRISNEKLQEREIEKRKKRFEKMVACGQIKSIESGFKITAPEYVYKTDNN